MSVLAAAIRTLKVGNVWAHRSDLEHGFGFHFPAFHVWMACEKHFDRDSVDGSDSVPVPGVPQLRVGLDGLRSAQLGRLLGRQQVSGFAHLTPTDSQRSARFAGLLRGFRPLPD